MGILRFHLPHVTSSIPLSGKHGSYAYAELQRDAFLELFDTGILQAASVTLELELLCRFIAYIASGAQGEGRDELLHDVWDHIEVHLLGNIDIHEVMGSSSSSSSSSIHHATYQHTMSLYMGARLAVKGWEWQTRSALFQAQAQAQICGIFGGQGNTRRYFAELRDLYQTYEPLLRDFAQRTGHVLQVLSSSARFSAQYSHTRGIRLVQWLEHPESEPSIESLLSAPVSFPLIGLSQLMRYKTVCCSLGLTPAAFIERFRSLAGHSQGIVVAFAVASAKTWAEFDQVAVQVMEILVSIGARCQEVFHQLPLAPEQAQKLEERGHRRPSPMLSVSSIAQRDLQRLLDQLNRPIAMPHRAHLSLVNSPSTFVVSGPQRTLAALVHALDHSASNAVTRFLPTTIPCHSPLLDAALPLIDEDLRTTVLSAPAVTLPIYPAAVPADSSWPRTNSDPNNIVPLLVRIVTSQPVLWPTVSFQNVTHAIDFGPGTAGGLSSITHENIAGSGVRLIVAGRPQDGHDQELGSLPEVFTTLPRGITWAPHWGSQFRPRIITTPSPPIIATRLSRLLKLPPFFVAGMTPTTTHPDFVAAIMHAGYHVEFAAGGYHDSSSLRAALRQLQDMMPIGRTMTVNVIYASPKALAWQIPLLRQLRAEGMPLAGLTVGGGVPSLEVATEYIKTLGLQHISFKPSTSAAIRRVIEIAEASPSFPIILQWTGGRGGGHHSAEDFHGPLLETYAAVRRQSNIILVAGSGFGSAEDVTPYLTGAWSLRYGKTSTMPIDGILFGSRVMACLEAHTSPGTKSAIAAAAGIGDDDWRGTYKASTGGVISIVSEMGEPLHVIATRGALLWSELDETVFSLERSKRSAVLSSKKPYIISRLNADFQRPWFGQRPDGTPCDITQMTYIQILRRLLDLMYVGRWAHPSHRHLVNKIIARTIARLAPEGHPSTIEVTGSMDGHPGVVLDQLLQAVPACASALFCSEDAHYLVQECRKPGIKPVPFIPVLDERFETWFKKDSLWQSEHLEMVVDRDAARTIILHGPVAARHTNVIDEPVAMVLDIIAQGTLERVAAYGLTDHNNDSEAFIGLQAYSDIWQQMVPRVQSGIIPVLQGPSYGWLTALLAVDFVVQGRTLVTNPLKSFLAKKPVTLLEHQREEISIHTSQSGRPDLKISWLDGRIQVAMYTHVTPSAASICVTFEYDYRPDVAFAPIWEIMERRNQRLCDLYRSLWVEQHSLSKPRPNNLEIEYRIEESRVRAFNQAIGYRSSGSQAGEVTDEVTLDFAMIVAWDVIAGMLLRQPRNILSLVHLSNGYEVHRGASQIKISDTLRVQARIGAVTSREGGLGMEIISELSLASTADVEVALTIRSCFLYREDDGTDLPIPNQKTVQASSGADREMLVHRSEVHVPSSAEAYSRASGDFNPIHTSEAFACFAGLPAPITHGMYCSAAVRDVLEKHLCGQHGERITSYEVDFVGMVFPGSTLSVGISLAGMDQGISQYRIEVRDMGRDERVLVGTAAVAQPPTTLVFTGQGSQEKGMGMDLYDSSATARDVWDRADIYSRTQFGFSILDIVRNNPKRLTVHFAGARGRQLRRNYQAMQYEMPADTPGGGAAARPMFPHIDDRCSSHTYASPLGLLYATQFAQPALALMEMAAFRDAQAEGVLGDDFRFTGHSLGEFAALTCSTGCMPVERLLHFCFCRGMTMQSAVSRDEHGRSDYSMVAVDPSRVAKDFNEASLRTVVDHIQAGTGALIEVVNLNVRNRQYVCAGDLRALDVLQKVCDDLKTKFDNTTETRLEEILKESLDKAVLLHDAGKASTDVTLGRGRATVPLTGIDVPFHSSYLWPRMEAFRSMLLKNLDKERLVPHKLVGRYIPNVTGTPFRLDRSYFEEAFEITGSDKVGEILNAWPWWMERVRSERLSQEITAYA